MSQERYTGIVVLLLAVLLFAVVIPLGIDSPNQIDNAALAPDLWPKIIVMLFGFTGVLMIVRPRIRNQEEDSELQLLSRLPRLLYVVGVLFLFYYAIPKAGMVIPSIVTILLLVYFAGERRWYLSLLIGVLLPVLLYGFFVYVARIPIPLGIFEGLI